MSKRKDDLSRVVLERTPAGLTPVSAYDRERLSRYPIGSRLEADLRQPRSGPHHRLYWVVLGIVAQNNEHWKTAEDLHWAIRVELRMVQEMILLDGSVALRPRSTSFVEMDQAEFAKFFDDAMEIISTQVIPGMDVNALLAEGRRSVSPDRLAV